MCERMNELMASYKVSRSDETMKKMIAHQQVHKQCAYYVNTFSLLEADGLEFLDDFGTEEFA